MTLVWLAAILLFIVAAFTWMIWDVGHQFRKQSRAIAVAWERDGRRAEDQAWANRLADYQAAQTITLQRAEVVTADALAELLTRPRPLEVVG